MGIETDLRFRRCYKFFVRTTKFPESQNLAPHADNWIRIQVTWISITSTVCLHRKITTRYFAFYLNTKKNALKLFFFEKKMWREDSFMIYLSLKKSVFYNLDLVTKN